MAISAEYRSTFVSLRRLWSRLYIERFSSGMKTPQTYKQNVFVMSTHKQDNGVKFCDIQFVYIYLALLIFSKYKFQLPQGKL